MTAHRAFYDPRLSPQENKACEMAFNGFRTDEIADELDISNKHVSVLLYKARCRGIAVRAKRAPHPCRWPDEHLMTLYRKGLTYAQIGERTGLAKGTIGVRLWRARQRLGLPPLRKPGNDPAAVKTWERALKGGVRAAIIAAKVGKSRNAVLAAVRRARAKQHQQGSRAA